MTNELKSSTLRPAFLRLHHSSFVIFNVSTHPHSARKQPADETILTHIKPLARMTGAKLLLVHVADGWVARNFDQLKLAESEEMKQDRAISGKTQP